MTSNNIAMTVYDMWDFLHPDKTDKPPQYKAHMLQRLVKSAIDNNNIKIIQVKTREFTRGCGRIIYVAQPNNLNNIKNN
jgi:ribosomal protein L17